MHQKKGFSVEEQVGNRDNSKGRMFHEMRNPENEKDNQRTIKPYRPLRTVFAVIIYAAYMLPPF